MDVRAALAEAAGLVLPVECAGCGRWDVVVCERCLAVLACPPARCEEDAPLLAGGGTLPVLPTWSLGDYRGPLRSMVLGWKNHRRRDVAPAVLAAARAAGATWAADPDLLALLASGGGPADGEVAAPTQVAVVPAPSGWRRRAARKLVVAELADAVARGLATGWRAAPPPGPAPTRVVVADLLRRRGGRAHQAGIGARGRVANRDGTVVALAALPPGTAAVVVDDVLTTGATLAACAAALRGGGAPVLGAFVLASTPAPTRRRAPAVP